MSRGKEPADNGRKKKKITFTWVHEKNDVEKRNTTRGKRAMFILKAVTQNVVWGW